MNKAQRKAIAAVIEQIDALRGVIGELSEQERQSYENLPENMKNGWRADSILCAEEALDEAGNDLENAIASLVQAAGYK